MFWQNKKSESFEKIIELLKIIKVELAKHDAQIDLINGKLRKKIYKDAEIEVKSPTEDFKYNDGFDELRKLNKSEESGTSYI